MNAAFARTARVATRWLLRGAGACRAPGPLKRFVLRRGVKWLLRRL